MTYLAPVWVKTYGVNLVGMLLVAAAAAEASSVVSCSSSSTIVALQAFFTNAASNTWSLKWPTSDRFLSQTFTSVKCLVMRSPAWYSVGHSTNMKHFSTNLSFNQATSILCVLDMCLMLGFLPVITIRHAAELSSISLIVICFPSTFSHKLRAGIACFASPWSIATISASGVDLDTDVCFLLTAASGTNDVGPTMHMKIPDVLFASFRSPARSASQYNTSSRSFFWSPTHPYIFKFKVLLM